MGIVQEYFSQKAAKFLVKKLCKVNFCKNYKVFQPSVLESLHDRIKTRLNNGKIGTDYRNIIKEMKEISKKISTLKKECDNITLNIIKLKEQIEESQNQKSKMFIEKHINKLKDELKSLEEKLIKNNYELSKLEEQELSMRKKKEEILEEAKKCNQVVIKEFINLSSAGDIKKFFSNDSELRSFVKFTSSGYKNKDASFPIIVNFGDQSLFEKMDIKKHPNKQKKIVLVSKKNETINIDMDNDTNFDKYIKKCVSYNQLLTQLPKAKLNRAELLNITPT